MECPICLMEINNDEMCITSCMHKFCNICLIRWLDTETAVCPICREIIKHFDYQNKHTKIISIASNLKNETVLPNL